MKKQSQNTMSPLSLNQVEALTNVVNETLATGLNKPRIFGSVDMWDLQRRSRTMMQRRNYFA